MWCVPPGGPAIHRPAPDRAKNLITATADRLNTNPAARAAGRQLLWQLVKGNTITGQVVRQSGDFLTIREQYPRTNHLDTFYLPPSAVSWQGGWQFVGNAYRVWPHEWVNLTVEHESITGILPTVASAYGRVQWATREWVLIRPVKVRPRENPACGILQSPSIVARMTPWTVWSSPPYRLPRGSLLQYAVYGGPESPRLLGAVEDYGPAPCSGLAPGPL
ncbi:hypothetical protein TPY_1110 [Sulfobacillus acidophilus TPY]|uniref:Uncharacterized protein n=1 Tax=Sulfobacillus acidophilus (strain ATCC 700253 / DSM 10332 / NAL) TaxID=679936 RepID=G8TWL4_SULAD|nr:hypothetical protein TPY_1110 [Sulfobacillus acidophilus TPY]AEW06003.1 hypothetical protein Sulac_2541 [Sulfobacillus acidophilus DSM 10332]